MLYIITNIVLSTNVPEQTLHPLQPEVELCEVRSKRKPFDMIFKNIYNITYDGDAQRAKHLTLALDYALSADVRAQLAQHLSLTSDGFTKFVLLSLITLCKSGCVYAVNVLLNHVRDYVNEDDWTCAHLCQIKTHLESIRNNGALLPGSAVLPELDSHLGPIYLAVLLQQQGKSVAALTQDQLSQKLSDELKLCVKDDMNFVELFYPKRVTVTIKEQIHAMRKQGKDIKEISETVGFSLQTVKKHLVPEETFADIFSSLLPKKWIGRSAKAADEAGLLLADQSQFNAAGDSQQRARSSARKTKKE